MRHTSWLEVLAARLNIIALKVGVMRVVVSEMGHFMCIIKVINLFHSSSIDSENMSVVSARLITPPQAFIQVSGGHVLRENSLTSDDIRNTCWCLSQSQLLFPDYESCEIQHFVERMIPLFL